LTPAQFKTLMQRLGAIALAVGRSMAGVAAPVVEQRERIPVD